MLPDAILVIPCYNEAARLVPEELLRLTDVLGASLVLVDDGSTDGTAQVLGDVCGKSGGRATFLHLEENRGKAEAVRRGMLEALRHDPHVVGYLDADLSTPVEDVGRLLQAIRTDKVHIVLGSRVALLGKRIERHHARHILGRAFATLASLALDVVVYDTQCGAKLFKNTEKLRAALATPFRSGWAFDVELLGRFLYPEDEAVAALSQDQILEIPLDVWRHQPGSKMRVRDMLRSVVDLTRLGLELRGRPAWQAKVKHR
jgi:glycosyltransferase involved in cell wall biosynthesis